MDFNKATIVKLRKAGEEFEVLVELEKALKFRKNERISLDDVLVADTVYKDSKKGMRASENEMKKIFGTDDSRKVAEIVIREGNLEVNADHKRKLFEEKRKQIVSIIHKNAIDPRTKLPHPPQRIEAAMIEAKVKISEFKNAEDQIQDVVKQLTGVLPIKFETRIIEVKVAAHFAGKVNNVLKNFGKIKKSEWGNDGSLKAEVEMPAGLSTEFYDEINRISHGEIETKIIS